MSSGKSKLSVGSGCIRGASSAALSAEFRVGLAIAKRNEKGKKRKNKKIRVKQKERTERALFLKYCHVMVLGSRDY